jgi:lactate dehydrogenase-like 2-hydroxyacid dehydrogenase
MRPTRPKLVITQAMTGPVMARIIRDFDASLPPPGGMTRRTMLDRLNTTQADALIFNGLIPLDAGTIGKLPASLRVVVTCTVGVDHVDRDALTARGIILANTPGVSDESVADFAMLLILAAARRLIEYDCHVRRGWGQHFPMNQFLGMDVRHKKLGIVGMGKIGSALGSRANAFGMKVLYHNRSRLPEDREGDATWFSSLDEMLAQSDILSLHAPLTPETAGLMDARRIALLPEGAIVINTARGALVDDDALIAALVSGRVRAAGLDVFITEPSPDPRYAGLPNVVLAPHMGGATEETRTAIGMACLDAIERVLGRAEDRRC